MTTDWVIMGSHRKTLASAARAIVLGSALMVAATLHPAFARGAAASPFTPVLTINDAAITAFELEQRTRFLTVLRAPGDAEKEALRALTQDRLAAAEARRYGLRLTDEQISQGMTEFASRANLSSDEFVAALAQGGVAAETFRDFVANGLLWRELVRGKYASTITVSEAEIDRAIAAGAARTQIQLLLSELVIPVEGDPADELALARRLQSEITSEDGFAAAARRYSASPSAGRGGRLDWTPAAELPGQIVGLVLALSGGQVSDPVPLPNAVVLFQLRDLRQDTAAASPSVEVEYAEFLIPNSASALADAAALTARIDTCKDLYAEARSVPPDRLAVSTRPVSEVPADVALLLAQLDPNEASTALVRGDWRVYLMLCARNPRGDAPIDRDAIRNTLISQKLGLSSELYLEELRSEAIIKTP